jgi:hypothetical protein
MQTKVCTTCGEEKVETEFNLNGSPTSRRNQCKACQKVYNAQRLQEKRKDPDFVEKEKKRVKDNYYRLYRNKNLIARKGEEKLDLEERIN